MRSDVGDHVIMDWQIIQTMIDQNRQMLNQQNKLFTVFANGNQSQSKQTTNDNNAGLSKAILNSAG